MTKREHFGKIKGSKDWILFLQFIGIMGTLKYRQQTVYTGGL